MEFSGFVERLRAGKAPGFPTDANTAEFAAKLDSQDTISHLRDQFILPTKKSLRKKALDGTIPGVPATNGHTNGTNGHANGTNGEHAAADDDATGIYFCGNSLGCQPKAVRKYIEAQLETWASIGVGGHFTNLENSPLANWQDMAEACAKQSAGIVGASPSEIVIMNTLSINLHLMMASFYKPTEKKHKIILEWRPFPSDWYAIESQIKWHGLDPEKSMVPIQPDENFYISTEKILATIDEHAEEAAMILLPGIQYYSGQLFDIPTITKYAQEKGLVVGWDLAHAAGNVELSLHDWNVDFACWCTYKYMNAGPGAIAGAYVHERHGKVEIDAATGRAVFRPRLSGWYGGDKSVRFNMDNNFLPTAGAGGYQCSNPSAVDLAALGGALSVFDMTDMRTLRSKSLVLTAYAELLLNEILAGQAAAESSSASAEPAFRILTPADPLQRGGQLSVLLRDGLLDNVSKELTAEGIICDKRKPGVIRVAPVPLYCTFTDVWKFMQVLKNALP
ncbi:pyridoxal phosphate-dependent transferase [Xylariales sp. PMI_506]|nr:pyridoxal phosphate-dependent transferase [Xylariales sp. PMI_506]